jgi:hypothetical protein
MQVVEKARVHPTTWTFRSNEDQQRHLIIITNCEK